jgi:hypothetical protein
MQMCEEDGSLSRTRETRRGAGAHRASSFPAAYRCIQVGPKICDAAIRFDPAKLTVAGRPIARNIVRNIDWHAPIRVEFQPCRHLVREVRVPDRSSRIVLQYATTQRSAYPDPASSCLGSPGNRIATRECARRTDVNGADSVTTTTWCLFQNNAHDGAHKVQATAHDGVRQVVGARLREHSHLLTQSQPSCALAGRSGKVN